MPSEFAAVFSDHKIFQARIFFTEHESARRVPYGGAWSLSPQQQQEQPQQNLQQFAALVGLHDAHPDSRHHIKRLKTHIPATDSAVQAAHLLHLHWLQTLDTRSLLSTLAVPQLHVFGANDALIPVAMVSQLALSTSAHTHVIAGASHLLPLTHSHNCVQYLHAWLTSQL